MEVKDFITENLLYGRALIDLEVSNAGSNPLWKGFVLTHNGEIPAYIKKCRNPDGLCIEIISALIGRWLNIPIPKPILVLVEPNHPQIHVGEKSFLFGSEMYDMPSFERFLRNSDDINEDCILEYKKLPEILAFDELIANPDRNNSNILYDGKSFRFIDHEKAFAANQNPRLCINEDYKIANISDIVQHYKGQNDVYIHKLMSKIKKFITDEIQTTGCDRLVSESKNNKVLITYNHLLERIRTFLVARLEYLVVLIHNSIIPPNDSNQLSLLGD